MAVATTSTNSANLYLYYVRKLLTTLEPRLQLYKLGRKTTLPEGFGKQVKWLLYSAIAGSTAALTEGTAPSEIGFTTANVTATIAQYGQFSKVSDLLSMTAIDPVLESLSERFGRAGAKTVEQLIIAELDASLTARFVNGRANADAIKATDVVVMKEFIKAMIDLKQNYVGAHEMGAYMAVLNAANEYDLISETNLGAWLHVREQAAQDKASVLDGEIGKLYGMRFVVSDLMTSTANSSSIAVKNNYLIGEECYGVVDLKGKNVELIIKDRESGGVANPLNQYATVGYKLSGFVAKNFAAGRGRLIQGATSLS